MRIRTIVLSLLFLTAPSLGKEPPRKPKPVPTDKRKQEPQEPYDCNRHGQCRCDDPNWHGTTPCDPNPKITNETRAQRCARLERECRQGSRLACVAYRNEC